VFTAISILAWFQFACVWCHPDDELSREFLDRSMLERRETIGRYAPAVQVDLYLLAMQCSHPGDSGLASSVAVTGESIVPAFLKRLETADRERVKFYILDVFWRMHETGSYSVGSDATLMAILERESSALSDPGLKELAESMISKMRVPDNANGQ
jgi:hypothetical protein